MENYILDTNIFFNMEEGLNLGEKTEGVIVEMTHIAENIKRKSKGVFYMPPRIVEEVLSFFENKTQPFLTKLLSAITIQSPQIDSISFSAQVFYKLIEDIRGRSYRGLRIGEEEIENGARLMLGKKDLDKKDFEITVGKAIRGFRDRYRQATRYGFLDSVADLDLICLAKELNGTIISTDEGVLQWGRLFGVKEMSVSAFGEKMTEFRS